MSGYARWMEKSFNAATATFPPEPRVAPTITGTGTVGQVLNVNSTGTWTNSPSSYAYQWVRGNPSSFVNIGTNSANYTLVAGDSGFNIRCIVSAVNSAGTTAGQPTEPIRCA